MHILTRNCLFSSPAYAFTGIVNVEQTVFERFNCFK